MEYVYLSVAIFAALFAVKASEIVFEYFLAIHNAKKRKELFEKLNDRLIENYAHVDDVDSVVKEWQGE